MMDKSLPLGRKIALFRDLEEVESSVGATDAIPPVERAKVAFETLAVMVNGMHSAAFVANVLENVLKMPGEDVARVSLSRAHLAEKEPSPEGEQMGALGEAADDGRCDEREREVEDELDRMRFASGETVGVEVGVMFVVEVLEHELYVEQAMRPVEQGVFEDIEEGELEEELRDSGKVLDGAGEASGRQQRVAD